MNLYMLFPYITLALLVITAMTISTPWILRVGLGIQLAISYFFALLTPIGLATVFIFWGLCELYRLYPIAKNGLNFFYMLGLLAIAFCFANHLIPGFNNLKVINALQLSTHSTPFSMYLNLDKTMAALILLIASGLYIKKATPFDFSTVRKILIITTCCIAVLMPLALLSGFIALDPKFLSIFWLWALNNLLFVCFAEELIFRGIIQNYLMKMAHKRGLPPIIPIFITAVLFATLLLGHTYGGILYMLFVTIAGMFYGYAYYATRRLEAAILVHFGVNACHFLLFTYPALVR